MKLKPADRNEEWLGPRSNNLRTLRGWSQGKLVERVNVVQVVVSAHKSGKLHLTPDRILRFAAVLKAPNAELLRGSKSTRAAKKQAVNRFETHPVVGPVHAAFP